MYQNFIALQRCARTDRVAAVFSFPYECRGQLRLVGRFERNGSSELGIRNLGDKVTPVRSPDLQLCIYVQHHAYKGGVFLLRQSGLTDLARCVCRSFIRPSISFLVF